MVDQLNHIGGKLYPRAVNASVEGHLRPRGQQRLTPSSLSDVNSSHGHASRAESTKSRSGTAGVEAGQQAAGHRELADHLNLALQQAWQKTGRHKSVPAPGLQASERVNQQYLAGEQPRQMKLLDELA